MVHSEAGIQQQRRGTEKMRAEKTKEIGSRHPKKTRKLRDYRGYSAQRCTAKPKARARTHRRDMRKVSAPYATGAVQRIGRYTVRAQTESRQKPGKHGAHHMGYAERT